MYFCFKNGERNDEHNETTLNEPQTIFIHTIYNNNSYRTSVKCKFRHIFTYNVYSKTASWEYFNTPGGHRIIITISCIQFIIFIGFN